MITTAKVLDETDKKIINLIKQGKPYREISQLIYISIPSIKYRIGAMKEAYKCKTLPELIFILKDENIVPPSL